jgi:pimeloyl-ACP methyl ester carboxylesterase
MDGRRHDITSRDGTRIGLLTAGSGPVLLLVHGGMGQLEGWAPLWELLTGHWQVTAMDRRGRGSSGDTAPYALGKECDDVAAVAASLASATGGPVDVLGHSYGATCVLGAAASGAPFRRIALYEPPGPQTVPAQWRQHVGTMISEGKTGRAMVSFLTEVVGLSDEQVEALKTAPRAYDVMSLVTTTMPREAAAIASADLAAAAAAVTVPVLLICGTASPAWARVITRELSDTLARATVAELPGCGHDAVDAAPGLLGDVLLRSLI